MNNFSPNIDNSKIFLVNKSELAYRLDPNYLKIKKEIVDNFKYPLERIGLSFIIKDGDHDKLPENAVSNKKNGKRYLRAQDLKNDRIIDEKPIYITEEYFNKIKRCHIYPGDLLLSIMASVGAASIVPENFPISTANRAIGILRRKPNSKFLTEYVQVLINTDIGLSLFEIEKKGGIQQRLNLSDISNVSLPCPSFEIQNKIVDLYKQASQIKEKKKKEAKSLLQSIDKYLLSQLGIDIPERDNSFSNRVFEVNWSELFGDRLDSEFSQVYFREISKSLINGKHSVSKLKEVTSFIESGSRPKGGVGRITSGVFSIGGEHVNDKCQVGNGKPKYIPLEFHEKIKLTETKMHDIILVKDGATTGKIGIIDSLDYVNQNVNEHVFLIRPETSIISPQYLVSFLYSSIGQILLKRFITGATVTGLTKESLRNILIPLPPLEVQNRITEHIFELREKAKQLELEAKFVLKEAKGKIEKMIIG